MSGQIEAVRMDEQRTDVHLENAYKPLGMSVLSAAASLKKQEKAKPSTAVLDWEDQN